MVNRDRLLDRVDILLVLLAAKDLYLIVFELLLLLVDHQVRLNQGSPLPWDFAKQRQERWNYLLIIGYKINELLPLFISHLKSINC